jgi:cytochrome c-type biogenesis protein CcsB
MEILYNQTNIFKRLFPFYLVLGIILSAIFFVEVFKPTVRVGKINRIFAGILMVGFAIQTVGLILRWYVSGHAPWSNGYESMLYISWVTVLAGLIFMKKSPMTLAVSAMLAGVTLLTAHMSWMNPEITNLVPVLKSYWLTIHVATITASYGFLGLGTMLAFMNLCLMIFRSRKNQTRINLVLTELSIVIELSLIVGLVLLIIGNFLGGIWANESWGRYWGWDPKETWTLVTIITYSFILHMGLIPRMKNPFSFNFASLIAFGTVLMTYFGVNFYLSGLHSYAQGDPVPIPSFVYYLLGIIFLVSVLAGINNLRFRPVSRSDQE